MLQDAARDNLKCPERERGRRGKGWEKEKKGKGEGECKEEKDTKKQKRVTSSTGKQSGEKNAYTRADVGFDTKKLQTSNCNYL